MQKLLEIWQLFSDSAKKLKKNRPMVLSAATAFFTIFSIPPAIIITVNALSLYFKSENITASLANNIAMLFGENVANQMNNIADNFSQMASQPWITIAGSVFLVFVATNLFNVIKMSINQIWNIRHTPAKSTLLHELKKRGIALGIILLTSILFILSAVADSIITVLESILPANFLSIDTLIILIVSKILAIIFVTLWFAAVFRFMPDARVPRKAIFTGAMVTSVLFITGKYILEELLINSNIDNIFETSTSVVVIMLFIFYSSFIMYYGVCFTQVYTDYLDKSLKLRKNARRVEIRTVKKSE
ncbi:MAG: YihY/virulence factor BrkB family protein [Fulvivirga sp.]|nr:YihY/virulence factor BrkB family protein [Fulvivirga sp.]